MASLEILEYPDPRLTRPSLAVEDFDDGLRELADNLWDTLQATGGIGLSAPQVNDRRRVLVMDLTDRTSPPEFYVNPQIVQSAMPGLVEESCLSVPGVVANVIRATQVRVRAQHCNGEPFERELQGMAAVCLQHEMDHLDGRLFVDRLSFLRRLRVRASLRALQQQSASARDVA